MLCYAIYFCPNSDGIPYTKIYGIPWILQILRASLYNMYEFQYFKCKFVRIKSNISGLAEVESVGFFHSPLIDNTLISPTELVS
jgi:hypothetical protein